MTGRAIETTVPSMNTRLEPKIVAVRIQRAEEARTGMAIAAAVATRKPPPLRRI
jgi:hypothetical protein